MAHEYLADLNTEQRHAVEHGIDAEYATTALPLLVIAGAGSGKTKTLAHRVAHLVVNGVDPHRILLLTFTRRAAEEMIRRVKRIFTHQQAKLGDRHVYASRSRFIPDSILGSFATRNWRDQTDGPIKVARKAGAPIDVAASLMRMWR